MRWREPGFRYICNILLKKKKKTVRSKYDKNLNILNLSDWYISDYNLMLFHIFGLTIYLKYP